MPVAGSRNPHLLNARGDVLGVVCTSDTYSATAHPRLSFSQYVDDQHGDGKGQITFTPWGNALELAPSPYPVKFSSDGRFAIVNSMHVYANGRGTVTSIQLAATNDAEGRSQISGALSIAILNRDVWSWSG